MSATDEFEPWWRRRPDRLRWELANFADEGLHAEVHHSADGSPIIHTSVELRDGSAVPIRVSFPWEYPLAHPTVSVQSGLLGPPHEGGGQLCLFDDAGSQWHPQRSAAKLVKENALGLVEDVLFGGADVVARNEEQIPDVASHRYAADDDHAVVVPDPFWNAPPDGATTGAFLLALGSERALLVGASDFGQAADGLDLMLDCRAGVALGRWVALDSAPPGYHGASSMFGYARERLPGLLEPFLIKHTERLPEWIALTYPEQGPGRDQWRRGWSFVELEHQDGQLRPLRMPQTQALTSAERGLRLPELAGIERAKIVIVGAGSLGSPVALELAKAGTGELVIVDSDRYDVNNAVRHVLPVAETTRLKAEAVADACRALNPFCNARAINRRIGQGLQSAQDFLSQLAGAHLVVETTGSRSVTRIAQRWCRVASVPLLSASLTRGSRGGDIVVLQPDDCFDCFLLAQHHGDIPAPAKGDQPLVVPVNCGDAAFSGTGFDATFLAAAVARRAVASTGLTVYPAADNNWEVLNFTRSPHWGQGRLELATECGHFR